VPDIRRSQCQNCCLGLVKIGLGLKILWSRPYSFGISFESVLFNCGTGSCGDYSVVEKKQSFTASYKCFLPINQLSTKSTNFGSPQKGDIQNCYVNTGQHAEIQNGAGDGELSKQLSSTVAVVTKQANHLNLQRYCHSATSVIASSIT